MLSAIPSAALQRSIVDAMADDPHNTSDISEHNEPTAPAKEDAETTAARRELKQTTISEKRGRDAVQLSQDDKSASEDDAPRSKTRRITPPADLRPNNDDALKEQVSSPKKKRAHDELDENKDVTPLGETPDKATAGAAAVQDRTDRSEPEKKRPRDRQASASAVQSGKEEVVSCRLLDAFQPLPPFSTTLSPSCFLPGNTVDTGTPLGQHHAEIEHGADGRKGFGNSHYQA